MKGAQGEGAALADLPVPGKYRWVPDRVPAGSPYNVAQLYVRLAECIRTGTPVSPGFDAAVARHRLLDVIERASETGMKQIARRLSPGLVGQTASATVNGPPLECRLQGRIERAEKPGPVPLGKRGWPAGVRSKFP